jgi:hypothetical protein
MNMWEAQINQYITGQQHEYPQDEEEGAEDPQSYPILIVDQTTEN